MADAVATIEFAADLPGNSLHGKETCIELPYEQLQPERMRRELDEVVELDLPDHDKKAKHAWLTTMLSETSFDSMPVSVQVLRVGDLAWLMLPGEILWGIK